MGLFERLRGLVGGEDDAPEGRNGGSSGAESAPSAATDDRRTASPPTEPGSARSPADADPRHQGHGSHWDAVLPPERRDRGVERLVSTAVEEGEAVAGDPLGGTAVTGHRHGDGPLGTLAVAEGDTVVTAYPVAEGVPQEVALDPPAEWDTELEAWSRGHLAGGDGAVTLFPSNYFQGPPSRFEGEATASLAVLLYELGPAEYDTVVDEDGEEVDVSGMAGYRPYERGAPDDVVLRTTVETVDRISHQGLEAYRVRAPLIRADDGNVDVALYAGDHVVDAPPEPGQDVEGAGWLQAWIE